MDFGLQITKDEAAQLLERFDKDKNGTVNFSEFISTVTPPKEEAKE